MTTMSLSRLIIALLAGFLSLVFVGKSETVNLDPGSFKAAILSKIPPYIEWPKESVPPEGKEIILGTFGEVQFERLLVELLKNTTVNGRKLLVRSVTVPEEIAGCQIFFVPSTESERWQELRKTINTHGILTVTDAEKFVPESGFIFNLLVEKRLLEVSLKNAKEAGIGINSHLLRVAKIVK